MLFEHSKFQFRGLTRSAPPPILGEESKKRVSAHKCPCIYPISDLLSNIMPNIAFFISPPQVTGGGAGGIGVKLRNITAPQDGPHPPAPSAARIMGEGEICVKLALIVLKNSQLSSNESTNEQIASREASPLSHYSRSGGGLGG